MTESIERSEEMVLGLVEEKAPEKWVLTGGDDDDAVVEEEEDDEDDD